MNRITNISAGILASLLLLVALPSHASTKQHVWRLASPNHEQTFTYGTEQYRSWIMRGRDRHLALAIHFTNDPYVDRNNPRQYDNFIFDFPQITLGSDGRTFSFKAADGRIIPVARKFDVFLGTETRLLPNAFLTVKKPHGLLTLTLTVQDHNFPPEDD